MLTKNLWCFMLQENPQTRGGQNGEDAGIRMVTDPALSLHGSRYLHLRQCSVGWEWTRVRKRRRERQLLNNEQGLAALFRV
jgi:hypothetical protein